MKNAFLLLGFIIVFSSCSSNKNPESGSGIYTLDKEAPIQSIDELIKQMPGKAIYIDRWASWCNPCIEEFKHSEDLHDFLKDHEIEMVYLNSDTELEEEKWLDFINENQLEGKHLRLNSVLKADLIDKGIFIPMIPQYMIVGKDGKIINNKALRPSSGNDLYRQLQEALDL